MLPNAVLSLVLVSSSAHPSVAPEPLVHPWLKAPRPMTSWFMNFAIPRVLMATSNLVHTQSGTWLRRLKTAALSFAPIWKALDKPDAVFQSWHVTENQKKTWLKQSHKSRTNLSLAVASITTVLHLLIKTTTSALGQNADLPEKVKAMWRLPCPVVDKCSSWTPNFNFQGLGKECDSKHAQEPFRTIITQSSSVCHDLCSHILEGTKVDVNCPKRSLNQTPSVRRPFCGKEFCWQPVII